MLTHLSLFTGIGGVDLAAETAGFTTVGQCEIDDYCNLVLDKHWPDVPRWRDVRELTVESLRLAGVHRVDLLTGGYPCQPFSYAGRRGGTEDPRHLWPHMYRLIRELHPAWVVAENVRGHVTLGLDEVLVDLEGAGYETRTFVFTASAVGAPHKRERVFIVGHRPPVESSTGGKWSAGSEIEGVLRTLPGDERELYYVDGSGETRGLVASATSPRLERTAGALLQERIGRFAIDGDVADADESGLQRYGRLRKCADQLTSRPRSEPIQGGGELEPRLGRITDGIPTWLDRRWPAGPKEPQHEWEAPRVAKGIPNRAARLKALGNAVLPAQVYPIFKAIADQMRENAYV